ncbi:transforming growth factor beta receptor type 3 [Lepeophtheirus salmonis]|uniref:transforming growth factor beta receptor type 3 n=1 Tax=Lepeophtheirus salmonis TaxID=72036 RepID=UPI001AE9424A|nr:transforming growth factor beta receptor type 3-like isoform X1 [Lepeophtheirus salmonis]XP_040583466.1 transforming growth factor beta receptor type 3-like isoform X1 [Lepeophtheirus salmonis]
MNIRRRKVLRIPSSGRFLSILLQLFLCSSSFASNLTTSLEEIEHYCDESSPLSTKYFIPFYESSRTTIGCVSKVSSDSPAVHVVKLNNSNSYVKDIILLTVNDHGEYSNGNGMVLILISNYPVNWRISLITNDLNLLKGKHTVILSADSNIVEKNFRIHNLQQVRDSPSSLSSSAIKSYVNNQWGAITTFSQIGVALRIKIALPPSDSLPEVCDLETSSPSEGVYSYFIEKKEATGCYHEEMAGTSEFDVYLIDLEAADNSSLHQPNNASVYLSLNPDIKLTHGAALNRDLILVLKSSQPVRWLLQSTDLAGNLTVISNGENVEDFSLASSQRLKIIKQQLPNSLNSLRSSVLTDVGSSSVVSYIKVELANVLTLIIPPRSKSGLVSVYGHREFRGSSELSRNHPKTNMLLGNDRSIIIPEKAGRTQNINISKEYEQLKFHLWTSMKKDCNQKETSVMFPRSIIEEFNITKMTLNDPSCTASINGSYVILKSVGTSCGSLNYFSGKHPMLKNNVRLYIEGDTKLQIRIPFNCRFQNGFPGFPSSSSENQDASEEDDLDDDDEKDYYDEDDYGDEEMYELHVSRINKKRPEPLVKEFGQTAQLQIGDTIKVQTSFETRALLNLALERCWLADHSSPDSELLLEEDLWLIWEGCPSHENITVFSTLGGRNPSFAFTVSKEIAKMRKFYIFCVLGLCSPLATNNGNLKKCTDPTLSCKENDSLHVGPTAQQLSRRGPFYMIGKEDKPEALLHVEEEDLFTTTDFNNHIWPPSDKNKRGDGSPDKSDEEDSGVPNSGLRSSHVIMVGVPTEVAVAISIASFVIGASLTGILCCLHHRKKIPKESRRSMHELRHVNVRADCVDQHAELQSMIPSQIST